MPTINSLTPVLWTENIDETIRFYTEHFNFEIKEKRDEWNWAILGKDKIDLMFAKPTQNGVVIKPNFTGSFYFNINDIDELWKNLNPEIKICYDLQSFDWGIKEFAIYDNNGYIIQFGEELKK